MFLLFFSLAKILMSLDFGFAFSGFMLQFVSKWAYSIGTHKNPT